MLTKIKKVNKNLKYKFWENISLGTFYFRKKQLFWEKINWF